MEMTEAQATTKPHNSVEVFRELFFLVIRQAVRDIGTGKIAQRKLDKGIEDPGERSLCQTQVRHGEVSSRWFGTDRHHPSEAFKYWCNRSGYSWSGHPLGTLLDMSDDEKVEAFKKASGGNNG